MQCGEQTWCPTQPAQHGELLTDTSNDSHERPPWDPFKFSRTQNLKFSAADAQLSQSRQHRASAQEHTNAAEAAQQAAATAAVQHQRFCQRRKQLLREVHLLHTAANHLQGALSCMRDKHHLVRKLRDVEYHRQHGRDPTDSERGPAPTRVAEVDVLQTQVDLFPLAALMCSVQGRHGLLSDEYGRELMSP